MTTQTIMTRYGYEAPACVCTGTLHPQCCYGGRTPGIFHERCCGDQVVPPTRRARWLDRTAKDLSGSIR